MIGIRKTSLVEAFQQFESQYLPRRYRLAGLCLFAGLCVYMFLGILVSDPHETVVGPAKSRLPVGPPLPKVEQPQKLPAPVPVTGLQSSRPRWNDFETLFVFGDSWTTTEFDPAGEQPSLLNPLGNPGLPQDGLTKPPIWIHYLTTQLNSSLIFTYNLAHGAASIDRDVVPPHPLLNFTHTFREQISDDFRTYYVGQNASASWDSSKSLFLVWFGLVDISLLFSEGKIPDPSMATDLAMALGSCITELYVLGARNIALFTPGPVELRPDMKAIQGLKDFVSSYNEALFKLKDGFNQENPGARLFLFDVHQLLVDIINNPASQHETARLMNVTENCWDYNPGYYDMQGLKPLAWDAFIPTCDLPVNQYFWVDALHVTYPVHEAIADAFRRECFLELNLTRCHT